MCNLTYSVILLFNLDLLFVISNMSFLCLEPSPSPTKFQCTKNITQYEAHTTKLSTTNRTRVSSTSPNTFILIYNGKTVVSNASIITVSVNSTLTMQYTVKHLHDKLYFCHNEKTTDRVFDRHPFLIIPNVQQSDNGIYEIIAKDEDGDTKLYFKLQIKTSYSATDNPGTTDTSTTDTSGKTKRSVPTDKFTTEVANGYTRRLTSTIATKSSLDSIRLPDTWQS